MVISSVKLRRDIERTERKISELDEEMDVLEVRLLNANKGKKTALEKKIERLDAKWEILDSKLTELKKQLAAVDPNYKYEEEELSGSEDSENKKSSESEKINNKLKSSDSSQSEEIKEKESDEKNNKNQENNKNEEEEFEEKMAKIPRGRERKSKRGSIIKEELQKQLEGFSAGPAGWKISLGDITEASIQSLTESNTSSEEVAALEKLSKSVDVSSQDSLTSLVDNLDVNSLSSSLGASPKTEKKVEDKSAEEKPKRALGENQSLTSAVVTSKEEPIKATRSQSMTDGKPKKADEKIKKEAIHSTVLEWLGDAATVDPKKKEKEKKSTFQSLTQKFSGKEKEQFKEAAAKEAAGTVSDKKSRSTKSGWKGTAARSKDAPTASSEGDVSDKRRSTGTARPKDIPQAVLDEAAASAQAAAQSTSEKRGAWKSTRKDPLPDGEDKKGSKGTIKKKKEKVQRTGSKKKMKESVDEQKAADPVVATPSAGASATQASIDEKKERRKSFLDRFKSKKTKETPNSPTSGTRTSNQSEEEINKQFNEFLETVIKVDNDEIRELWEKRYPSAKEKLELMKNANRGKLFHILDDDITPAVMVQQLNVNPNEETLE